MSYGMSAKGLPTSFQGCGITNICRAAHQTLPGSIASSPSNVGQETTRISVKAGKNPRCPRSPDIRDLIGSTGVSHIRYSTTPEETRIYYECLTLDHGSTHEVLDKLRDKKTSMGASLWDCIQSGVVNLDSGVGIYAPDAESYNVFANLFHPVINEYHIGFDLTKGARHPPSDFGMDKLNFPNPDPDGQYIISTRVRCGRSLKGYPFNPLLTEAQYLEMESKVQQALKNFSGELAGRYYPLKGMTKDVQNQLIEDHFLFKEGDRFLQAAQACRYWPDGRGIYHNEDKTFLIWVNEEDHLRIISMQKGGDLLTIYKRLITGVQQIEKHLPFSHDDKLGFLSFCPTNLGTTIRASVHIKLPKISKNQDEFHKIAARYNLQVRGTAGEHSDSIGGIYDISNKRRMGLTEFQAVKEMYDGVMELIKLEKSS